MNNSLFNTTQETATRLTLCLPLLSRPSTIDEITAIDLIATYMKTFGFGQRNLHGDGPMLGSARVFAHFGLRPSPWR